MIPFDFDYYRPDSVEVAVQIMESLRDQKKTGLYYSGGTEILSNFRKGKTKADAVIDLKAIKGMCGIEENGDYWSIGAATPLNSLVENPAFKDLNAVTCRVADHTIRNTLTIGGNICGKLPYREAVLPLLAVNAQLVIVSSEGFKTVAIQDVFKYRLSLDPTAFVYKINWPKGQSAQVYTQRETVHSEIDYPILHLYGHRAEKRLFVGLSGFAAYPVYQFFELDDQALQTTQEKHLSILSVFLPQVKSDERGSSEYRVHLLSQAITHMLNAFKEVRHD